MRSKIYTLCALLLLAAVCLTGCNQETVTQDKGTSAPPVQKDNASSGATSDTRSAPPLPK